MHWWIVGIGLASFALVFFLGWFFWLRPWSELERILTRIGRSEQPPTFLLSGTPRTRRVRRPRRPPPRRRGSGTTVGSPARARPAALERRCRSPRRSSGAH